MDRGSIDIIPRIGTVLVCCVGVMGNALAAPPLTKTMPVAPDNYRAMAEKHAALSAGTQATGAAEPRPALRLDLRPPTTGELAAWTPANRISGNKLVDTERFPLLHRSNDAKEYATFPAMGTEVDQSRWVGRAQVFAERFRREGLPVARLWENHGALVSLGLSPKGKPGLWLVQKTR